MREILFRGKRLCDDQWTYGSLIKFVGQDVIFAASGDYRGAYDVLPSTVGQYANQTDKSGTKIFEGDICRHRSIVGGKVLEDDVGDVFLYYGSWTLRDKFGYIAIGQCSPDSLEVIGNIHDNPELLEEGQHG